MRICTREGQIDPRNCVWVAWMQEEPGDMYAHADILNSAMQSFGDMISQGQPLRIGPSAWEGLAECLSIQVP